MQHKINITSTLANHGWILILNTHWVGQLHPWPTAWLQRWISQPLASAGLMAVGPWDLPRRPGCHRKRCCWLRRWSSPTQAATWPPWNWEAAWSSADISIALLTVLSHLPMFLEIAFCVWVQWWVPVLFNLKFPVKYFVKKFSSHFLSLSLFFKEVTLKGWGCETHIAYQLGAPRMTSNFTRTPHRKWGLPIRQFTTTFKCGNWHSVAVFHIDTFRPLIFKLQKMLCYAISIVNSKS